MADPQDKQQPQGPSDDQLVNSFAAKRAAPAQAPKQAAPAPRGSDAALVSSFEAKRNPPQEKKQPEPSMLDTANNYYNNVDPNSPWYSRVEKSLGRTGMMVPNLIHAVAAPATEEEKKQGFGTTLGGGGDFGKTVGGTTAALATHLPLVAHRLVVAPAEAAGTKAKESYKQGNYTEAAGHGLAAALPLVGPAAENIGERMGSGDVAGGATDLATLLAVPKIAKEAMPGGRLAAATERATGGAIPGRPWQSAFPTTRAVASRAAQIGSGIVDRTLTPRNLTSIATGGAGGGALHGIAPGAGELAGGGGGMVLGNKLSDMLYEHPDQPLSGKIPGVRSVLPKLRVAGSEHLIDPTEAAEHAAAGTEPPSAIDESGKVTPTRVAVPGGKTVSFDEWLKSQPSPKVQVMNPRDVSPAPQPEIDAAATKTLQDYQREGAIKDYNQKYYKSPEGHTINATRATIDPSKFTAPSPEPIDLTDEVNQLGKQTINESSEPNAAPRPVVAPEAQFESSFGPEHEQARSLAEWETGSPEGNFKAPAPTVENLAKQVVDQNFAKEPKAPEQARLEEKYPNRNDRSMAKANGEKITDAVGDDHKLMQSLHKLSNVDLRQALINAGEDMGQRTIGDTKYGGEDVLSRSAAFDRLLELGKKPHEIVDLAKQVEGKNPHMPPPAAKRVF